MLMKKQFQSKSVPRGTRTIWRYLGALFLLFTFAIGQMWAAYDVPNGEITLSQKVNNGGRFNVEASGLYHFRPSSGYSWDSGIKTQSNQGGVVFYLDESTEIEVTINHQESKNAHTVTVHVYSIPESEYKQFDDNKAGASESNRTFSTGPSTSTDNSFTISITAETKNFTGKKTLSAGYYAVVPTGSKSKTIFTKIKFTPSCSATAPGNISKGALNAGVLTLNAAGSPATNNVWYWQTSATGTSKTNSGTSFNVSAEGTYYVRSLYDNDCWSAAKSITVNATDLVANYTVIYKDGTTELGSETVEVGQHPTGSEIAAPTKDCYTFAGWDPALNTVSGTDGQVVNVNATWTAQYTSGTYEFTGHLTMGTDPQMTISNSSDGQNYAAGRIDNIYVSAQKIGYEATGDYGGWKLKTTNGTLRFMIENTCGIRVTIGEANPLRISYTEGGIAKSADIAKSTTSAIYKADANSLVTLTNFTGSNKTVTLKKIEILPLYTATRVDGKSDASGSDANVLETTLPTPATISGWTFTGWVANADVKAGENTKTAGMVLAAGTYTLLANTTFTAQWTEASSTYDVTYTSAHGTAPDAENAASVVLAELNAEGWAHKGWTANVDVTVDAATVEAGTLIANGKTAILASNVTFTAVWKEIFTVTFDAKGGSSVDPVDVEDGATLAAAPEDPTKDNYVFLGWSETDGGDVVADITAITISADKTFFAKWALDVQVSEIVFSNSFKGWIHDGQVEVFYMAGESAPTIVSYDGKNLKAEGGVVISGDKVIATGTDDSEKEYALTMTAVTPLTATGAQTFDGSEGYVKTRHAWTETRKWKMSKDGTDGRVARGETSMYIFLGAAESVTFDWGKQQKTNDVAVYVNGTFVKNLGKDNNSAVELTNGNNMVAFYSLQTSGDVWLNGLTVAPWVSVETVTLKEGEDAISSKEIWESTSFTLTAEVTPDNASNKTITWTSSNNDVATVVNGVVTGVAANASPVTITASTVDGVNATCVVTVTEAPSPCETPTINTQPASQAYCAGSEPTLSVDASVTDGGTLHYAWFKDDVAIGSDAATCVVTGAGTYKVVVTNKKEGKLDASVTSANAVVTLNAPASITTQPTDLKKQTEGANITLSVVAANATAYQWYSCDNKDKENPVLISGADEAEYEFAAAAGFFYCEVTGLCGNVESNVAQVTVKRSAGCQYITATSGYEATLADGLKLYTCGSDGKTSTDGIFADATSDVTTVDANAVGEFNKQYIIMKFPVDVEEITLYGTNSSDRSINSVRVKSTIGSTSADKFTDDMIVATTKTATREGKDISMTAVMDEPISKDDYVFVNFNGGSMHVYRICYTAAIERPVIATQPVSNTNFAFDADLTATVEVNAVSEGALYYQWYDASDDSEVDGATTTTLTTSVDGEYYVIVTNKLAGHKDNSVKSQTVALAHRDATDATLSALSYGGTAITLEDGVYEYAVLLDEGTTVVPALSATATMAAYGATAVPTDAAAFVDYKATSTVLVTAEDGATTQTYTVKFVVDHIYTALVDVTESTTWNWSGSAEAVINDVANKGLILANYIDGANFEMIEGKENERARRNQNGGCYQGTQLHFNTTVYGKVKIYFRAPSSGDNCTIYVNNNGKRMNVGNRGNSFGWSKEVVVKGDVVIEMVKDGGGDTRVQQIVFTQVAPDYTRNVSNNIGTLCVDHNVLVGGAMGATFYQIASRNELYNDKIDFEEVLPNEELKAGEPYIFQSTTGRIDLFYGETVATQPSAVRGMIGNYAASTLAINEDNQHTILYIAENKLWSCENIVGSTLKLNPNRAYINMELVPTYAEYQEAQTSNPAPRRRVTLGKNAEQVVTGVVNLNASEQPVKLLINGQIFILRGEKMFDATGRLVK